MINSNAVISRKEFQVTLCCPPIARKMDLTPANAVEKREGAAIKNISCMAARISRFSKDTQGIGLGLPLAKAIIEAHGGLIEVESELGIGTSFIMNFPIPTKL